MPVSRHDLGPFYHDVIAADPLEPYGAASAAYRLEVLARTLPFPVSGARLVPSNNNDVWRTEAGYLRVAWRGDRSRLAREAELLGRLHGFLPVPEVLDCGGDDRLSWSLTAAMPGTEYDHLCAQPAPAGLRDLAREVAALLRALHSWPVPGELAEMFRRPGTEPDPLRRAGAELVLPASSALRLIPLAGQLPFVDHGVLDAAAERLRELDSPVTAGGEVVLHGDFYLGNILVHDGHVSALIDFEFSRMGPRDLELISVIRALDMESRLGLQRPPLLAWLAEDYPELFAVPDLDRRLWRYALAYTIRQIIFWPPDRAEADGLEVTHPLHTLRRLIDAPLPLPAGCLPRLPAAHRTRRPASFTRGRAILLELSRLLSITIVLGVSRAGKTQRAVTSHAMTSPVHSVLHDQMGSCSTQHPLTFSVVSLVASYDSYMNKKVPITVTLDPRLREWAEHLVATGKAPSISAVINDALTESYTQHKRGLALLRERAEHADEDRVARMRAHIDAQAAALGLSDDE